MSCDDLGFAGPRKEQPFTGTPEEFIKAIDTAAQEAYENSI